MDPQQILLLWAVFANPYNPALDPGGLLPQWLGDQLQAVFQQSREHLEGLFIEAVTPLVWAQVCAQVQNQEDRQDIAQNALLHIFQRLGYFNPAVPPGGLIRTIVQHAIADYYQGQHPPLPLAAGPAAPAVGPQNWAELEETLLDVGCTPEEVAVVYCYLEDHTIKNVAFVNLAFRSIREWLEGNEPVPDLWALRHIFDAAIPGYTADALVEELQNQVVFRLYNTVTPPVPDGCALLSNVHEAGPPLSRWSGYRRTLLAGVCSTPCQEYARVRRLWRQAMERLPGNPGE